MDSIVMVILFNPPRDLGDQSLYNMQYSTFIQPVLFVLCMVSCPTWASAIPATNEVSNGIASIGNTANDGFLPYLIEEPHIGEQSSLGLVVPPKFNCGIAWCRNYKTHKTAIIVCAKPGFKIKRARVAGAAAKLANSCSYDKWKVNGILKDTTGYDIRVSGAGCN
ncbi:hypothetical protein TWF679_006406 [Orbilia oligospora]|uniref:Uncharacterized protein n=1 Tax=Orbilia oligospora TaxID=2813651 RepID=A0A8H8VA63_ORBOL|nr:hypothetical protein TWF679_006406 [Orbilia oligospora]